MERTVKGVATEPALPDGPRRTLVVRFSAQRLAHASPFVLPLSSML